MRKAPLTIGILAAELAAGALAAPPALADDDAAEPAAPVAVEQEPDTPDSRCPCHAGRRAHGPGRRRPAPPRSRPELPVAVPAAPDLRRPPTPRRRTPRRHPRPTLRATSRSRSDRRSRLLHARPRRRSPLLRLRRTPSRPATACGRSPAAPSRRDAGRERSILTAVEIVGYWVRVCEANRGRLRSGDVTSSSPARWSRCRPSERPSEAHGSRGRPSTRSPMMLRWISLVPPAIVRLRLNRNPRLQPGRLTLGDRAVGAGQLAARPPAPAGRGAHPAACAPRPPSRSGRRRRARPA